MRNKILILNLIVITAFNSSCTKVEKCKTCVINPEYKEVYIGESKLSGKNFRKNDGSVPGITFLNNKSENVLKTIIENTNIEIPSNKISGIALFYNVDVENYGQLKNYLPNTLLFYIQNNNNFITNCYFRNFEGKYVLNSTLTGITNMISGTDLINIDNGYTLNSKEIVLLFDSQKIPDEYYRSDFQVKTSNFSKPIPGDGPDPMKLCSIIPECKNMNIEGTCIFSEHQNGPESVICVPKLECPEKVITNSLINLGYSLNEKSHEYFYELRDNFLGKSLKGSKYIDDYYYTSKFITLNGLSTNFLLNSFKFCNSNMPFKLTQFNNDLYQDTILINSEDKTNILSILESSKNITPDVRFQNIINSLIIDLNKFTGKSINEIKNDFK